MSMFSAPHQAINVPVTGNANSTKNQASQGMSNFVDGSGPIFSMYLDMATEEDKELAESWKADADGILIFTGLFSAAVASLISVSVKDIRPNPQDTSNFYLANIYQAIADPNHLNNTSLPSPPTFSPPAYAVWVNAFWFMSLAINLTCALFATLLQQWARRYLKVTQPRYSPHRRAHIRTFFFEGIDKFLLPWAVEALPLLLHVTLSLFFAGLVVFLWNVNLTIFKLVLSWVGFCMAIYGCITVMPVFGLDSPYYTPLTSLVWPVVIGTLCVIFQVLWWFSRLVQACFHRGSSYRFGHLWHKYRKMFSQGMVKATEESALNSSSEIDTRAFMRTLESLDEDDDLERFFASLPDFHSSDKVGDLTLLTEKEKSKLSTALMGLFDRTFSSALLPESVKNWRAVTCARALDRDVFPNEYPVIMDRILFQDECKALRTANFGCTMSGWNKSGNQSTALVTQAIVTNIVAKAPRRDDSWFLLASNELGIPEYVLHDYAAHGDSLSLAILIHVIRQQFGYYGKRPWPVYEYGNLLEAISKFDVQDTSRDLQHEFCALWNDIVSTMQKDNARWMALEILRPIRNVYITLHRDTASTPTRFSSSTGNDHGVLRDPSAYPMCDVVSHVHDVSVSTTFARN